MPSKATTPEEYLASLPEERKAIIQKLRDIIFSNLPVGFSECMSYGMLAYAVPHTIYPTGYHCKPTEPLPFIYIASPKGHISFTHMGLYSNSDLLEWFSKEYPKHCKRKLDMGKGCIRFKYLDDVPYNLIEQLCKKLTVEEWIKQYESMIKK